MRSSLWRPLLALLAALVCAAAIAACGGGDDSSSATAADTSPTGETSTSGNGLAEAEAAIKPFVGQPSPFPVTEKLKEIPKGATIAFMDCGAPICAAMYAGLEPAAELMGVNLERFKAGYAANTVSAAFDSVVAKQPDAVIITAIEPPLYAKQLQELQAMDTPIVTTGVTRAEEFGIESPQYGQKGVELLASLQADYVAAKFGPESNVAYFGIPELAITKVSEAIFAQELERVCPTCEVHFTSISIATVGNTSVDAVVSDLQSNSDSNVAVFIAGEIAIGLPAALKAAGIEVETLSGAAIPQNLQQVEEGSETAVLATDTAVLAWTMLDQAAREIVGQKLTGPQAEGIGVNQFLAQEDITFDPAKGWNGYPDFAERFAKLWGVEG